MGEFDDYLFKCILIDEWTNFLYIEDRDREHSKTDVQRWDGAEVKTEGHQLLSETEECQ